MSLELRLPLKRKWFELTSPDGKQEDYREVTPYWIRRLMSEAFNRWYPDNQEAIDAILKHPDPSHLVKHHGKKFGVNVMTLGYPDCEDRSRFKVYEHAGIEVRTGKPEWGAEPGKIYFVILHGKQIRP